MPNFFQAAKKFLGFATEAKIAEVAFVKETMGATSQISMKVAGETHGYVAWETSGKTASVYSTMMSEQFKGKGYGTMMYEKAAEAARMEGFAEFTSDITGHTEAEAGHVWRALGRRGYKLTEATEGVKFKIDLTYQKIQHTVSKSVLMQEAAVVSERMLQTGEGHDTTTLLNRNMRMGSGSRRTNGAL